MLRSLAFTPPLTLGLCLLVFSSMAQEPVTKTLDGISVILPADEADLAEPMMKLAKAWRGALRKGKLSNNFRGYLMNPKAAQNTQRRVAKHLGITGDGVDTIRRDWEQAIKFAERAIAGWEEWESGFDTMRFWTKKEAEQFRQRNHLVFQDTEVEIKGDEAGFRIRPAFLPEPLVLEALPAPKAVPAHRLDFVLAYAVGSTPGQIVKQYNELLNATVSHPQNGTAAAAADIYDAMYRYVFERALERRAIKGEAGDFFRKSLSLAYTVARNDQIDPARGRKILFGRRIRRIASQEWRESIEDLAERIRRTPPSPSKADGPAEEATREVALAMVFLSLKHGGPSLDGWIQARKAPLDAKAFSLRLAEASDKDRGWERVFRGYCGSLADQFTKMFDIPPTGDSNPTLSEIEQQWPREISGRVEVVHPPELAETARLTAASVDEILTEHSDLGEGIQVPQLDEADYLLLRAHGLRPRDQSGAGWSEVYRRSANGGISKLRVRFWFIDDAKAALNAGKNIPGFEKDPLTGDISITHTLGVQRQHQLDTDPASANYENPVSSLIIPIPRDKAAILSPEIQAHAITKQCRKQLDVLFTSARTGETEEERFFNMALYTTGESLLIELIGSLDREWFVIGFSTWMAIQLTDAKFGSGVGERIFAKKWPPRKNEPDREKVNLTAWKSGSEGESHPLDAARSYFATKAITTAFDDKDAEFVSRFIEEIRKTPRKRTNIKTVYRAYKAVGGGDLKAIAQDVTAAPKP